MQKPEFLFHSSPNKDIVIFEPRNEKVRNPEEGPVVFATPYIDQASCFMVPTTDNWVNISLWGDLGRDKWHIIISDKEKFLAQDKGGAIYKLPSETFIQDKRFSTSESEWTSRVPVKPISKQIYSSGLEAMLENGVLVYFVNQETLDKINKNPDNGPEILSEFTPYKK